MSSLSIASSKAVPETGGRRVEIDNVWKEYGTFIAVEGINFSLEPGEFLTLLGPSGSGKTSTLMMVAGFEFPTRGAIRVDGVDVVSRSPKERNFGVVFQSYALFPHMSARENVEFPLRMRGWDRARRRRAALDMLDKVGLSAFAERKPREMSGGQQQRVALARALVFNPDALLLDEPLGALDKQLREQMQYEIKELQRKLGISILFVTHDQEEAMTMSDRIAVMDKGRIVQMGTPQDVYYHPATTFVASFLGETNLIPCKVAEASGAGLTVAFEDGKHCKALSPRLGVRPRAGEQAHLSVRPEKVRILRDGETADIVFDGIAKAQSFLGRHFRIIVSAMGRDMTVTTSDLELAQRTSPGNAVRIGWMREDAQALASERA